MSDPHYDKVVLLMPFAGDIQDYSSRRSATYYSPPSAAYNDNVVYKYYGNSANFATYPNRMFVWGTPADFTFDGDFTVEFWLYLKVTAQPSYAGIFCTNTVQYTDVTPAEGARTQSTAITCGTQPPGIARKITLNAYGVPSISGATVLNATQWYHVAISRTGDQLYIFIDGSIDAQATNTVVYRFYGQGHYNDYGSTIGCNIWDSSNGQSYINLNDLRVTKGVGRYTSNFTPPGKLVGTISGTVTDVNGTPVERKIFATPRLSPLKSFETTSNSSGFYTLTAPITEHSVVALDDDAGIQYNALVLDKIVPA